jgi:predicted branched-subunit amino acid permease
MIMSVESYIYFVPLITSLLCILAALTFHRNQNLINKKGELAICLLFALVPIANVFLTAGMIFLFSVTTFSRAWQRFNDWMDSPIFKNEYDQR